MSTSYDASHVITAFGRCLIYIRSHNGTLD